jgi:Kef-type K+ transport system membrane component KefB
MNLSEIFDISLPLTNPVVLFLVILIIILLVPIIFNRFKIPHILGLIFAGIIIGPNGFNLIVRDNGILLSGAAGLLYIMFLAGIEIDLVDFRKNSAKSIIFGMYTFLIPMSLGMLAGIYLLEFSIPTSILLASMFASHTLIVYPILSKLGITKNRAVSIGVGGTVITDTLALLVLAVIVGMARGEVDSVFWFRLTSSVIVFGLLVIFVFPIIARWFFKKFFDSVSQYIFVLALVFLGAVMAELAGIEAIIGAFLAGLSLNRLIPSTSPLMNRIEFVGNAIFIPFFLIGVGMLVDYRAFFSDTLTIYVAIVMTVVATVSKFIASWLAQKTFKLTLDERRLIFGLSNAQAAATLAAVTVGYNVIIGVTPQGEPIRLLNDAVLNGTIIMILVTCTIATFVAQRGANNISILETYAGQKDDALAEEKILIAVSNDRNIEENILLSTIIRSKRNRSGIYAMHVINSNEMNPASELRGLELLDKCAVVASSADIMIHKLLRFDTNVATGITNAIREHHINHMILGLHHTKDINHTSFGDITKNIIENSNTTTYIYKPTQPISTIKRHIVIVPERAEHEIGFPFWLVKIWNIARNTGGSLLFFGPEKTIQIIREVHLKHPLEAEFKIFDDWNDFLILSREVRKDDNLIIILSRHNKPSYHSVMNNIPALLNKYFRENSFILIYPMQMAINDEEMTHLRNPSILESIEKLDEIGKTIARVFRRK